MAKKPRQCSCQHRASYPHDLQIGCPGYRGPRPTPTPAQRLRKIRELIDRVENRAMAADGPVMKTRHVMSDEEMQQIYVLAGGTIGG